MRKTLLIVLALCGGITAVQAQHNQITAPFINTPFTGVCDSSVSMKWTGTQFKYASSIVFKLNTAGLAVQVNGYDSNGMKSNMIDILYNGDSKADSMVLTYYIGPQTFHSKTVFAYDGSGNITNESSLLELIPGMYDSSQTYDYIYNGSNQMTESIKRTKQSGSLKFKERFVFTYGSNGKVSKEEGFSYSGSVWTPNMDATFTYDGNNNQTQELRVGYPGPVNQYREISTYDTSNRRKLRTYEQWDVVGSAWKYTGKDSSYLIGIQNFDISYNWENNAWVLKDKDTCYTGSAPSGIADWTKLDMKIYPNPSHAAACVALDDAEGTGITVNTMDGRTVSVPLHKTSHAVVIDTQNLPAGIYLVRAVKGSAAATLKLSVIH